MLVLIVDDDHIAASSLADMINLLGHKTTIEHGPTSSYEQHPAQPASSHTPRPEHARRERAGSVSFY